MRQASNFCVGLAMVGLIAIGGGGNQVRAGLVGYTVSGGGAFNTSGGPFDSGTIFTNTGSTTVPGTIVNIPVFNYATFSDTSITQKVNGTYAAIPFNGVIYESEASAPIFTGVTLVSSTISGFTAADISYNSHEVALNFSGETAVGTAVLSFTTASSVPEPSSLVLVATAGLVGLGYLLRRRKQIVLRSPTA